MRLEKYYQPFSTHHFLLPQHTLSFAYIYHIQYISLYLYISLIRSLKLGISSCLRYTDSVEGTYDCITQAYWHLFESIRILKRLSSGICISLPHPGQYAKSTTDNVPHCGHSNSGALPHRILNYFLSDVFHSLIVTPPNPFLHRSLDSSCVGRVSTYQIRTYI